MNLFLSLTAPLPYSTKFSTLSCSFKPHRSPITITKTIPARDRIIDFGKHKGKMLGTLPSTYLKWVSKNLRARDFEHWAKLADQVLEDPVYKDRIEWEFAQNLLTGNKNAARNVATNENVSAVSELVELSERFGWDNEDKAAWSKIDFELLGTSKGGRIPRLSLDGRSGNEEKALLCKEERKERVGIVSKSEERRRERRTKVKEKLENVRVDNGNVDGIKGEKRDDDRNLTVEIHNPFPGREALLKKVLNRKKFS